MERHILDCVRHFGRRSALVRQLFHVPRQAWAGMMGVHESLLSPLEHGRLPGVKAGVVVRVAAYTGSSTDWLLGRKAAPPPRLVPMLRALRHYPGRVSKVLATDEELDHLLYHPRGPQVSYPVDTQETAMSLALAPSLAARRGQRPRHMQTLGWRTRWLRQVRKEPWDVYAAAVPCHPNTLRLLEWWLASDVWVSTVEALAQHHGVSTDFLLGQHQRVPRAVYTQAVAQPAGAWQAILPRPAPVVRHAPTA